MQNVSWYKPGVLIVQYTTIVRPSKKRYAGRKDAGVILFLRSKSP